MFREAQARNCNIIAKALNFDDDNANDTKTDLKLAEKSEKRPAV